MFEFPIFLLKLVGFVALILSLVGIVFFILAPWVFWLGETAFPAYATWVFNLVGAQDLRLGR